MTYETPVTKTQNPKPRPADESKLDFAKYFTDHMFVMEYDEGKGWHHCTKTVRQALRNADRCRRG